MLIAYPSPSSIQEEDEYADELDVDFVPPEEAKLEITDRAAEVCIVYSAGAVSRLYGV